MNFTEPSGVISLYCLDEILNQLIIINRFTHVQFIVLQIQSGPWVPMQSRCVSLQKWQKCSVDCQYFVCFYRTCSRCQGLFQVKNTMAVNSVEWFFCNYSLKYLCMWGTPQIHFKEQVWTLCHHKFEIR